MLSQSLKNMIIYEQEKQNGKFIDTDIESYFFKLNANAEIFIISENCIDKGFIAFYCNNQKTKIAFITLLLVNEKYRKQGIGYKLVNFVLKTAKERGFIKCNLEVLKENKKAYSLYTSFGFSIIEVKENKYLLSCNLRD
jgi:ribosomal protein S18 acetylase RimI-like enzyme